MLKSFYAALGIIVFLILTTFTTAWSMVKVTEYIVVDDSLKLATDIYLPDGAGQYPCILYRTPYSRENIKKEPEKFAEKGYAVVCQDTRGKFGSDGKFYPFRDDRSDGLATVNWIKQQPWYNGKICGWGGSYLGYTQWAISDQLDLLTPIFTTANMYEALYVDGLFSLALAHRWGFLVDSKTVNPIAPEKMEQSYSILPLSTADDSTFAQNDFTDDWLRHEFYDSFWGVMDHRAPITAPVFAAAGWYDIFLMPQINDFASIVDTKNHDSYLFVGPWAHGSFAAKIEYGENGDYGKMVAPILNRFVEKHLLNSNINIILPPFKDKPFQFFIMQRNEWYAADQWPPKAAKLSNFYLLPNGSIDRIYPKDNNNYSWVYDPGDPYPSLGGTNIGKDVGPAWQNDNVDRKDQLVFETEKLTNELLLLGPINAELYIETDAICSDIIVCLQDVFPDGKILNIQEGGAKIYNDSKDFPRKHRLEINAWATGYQINTGHKLRVVITSSWFPRFNRNLNTGEAIYNSKDIKISTQKLYVGKQNPSHIILPVLSLDED